MVLGLCAALVVTSCSRDSSKDSKPKKAPVPVVVGVAKTQDVSVEIEAIGAVRAYSTVSVRPQITGPIIDVHFKEGEEVRAGDLLFSLDPRPWEAALNQAQANLKRDEAQMINARLQFERTSNLFESKIASQQDYDSAEATYLAAQSTAMADNAAITNAQVNLGYTQIRAPIDGRTGSVDVKRGNVVKAPDDVLVTITQMRPIYVAFAVPEQELPAIRNRSRETTLPVKAFAPGDTDHPALGELTFIDNTVDTNTGTILLKATFANADHVLWPGQFVRTSLILSNLVQAVVVPSQAVQAGQSGEFVFVVKPDSAVELRPVTAGVMRDGWRVIQHGIKPGETVVTDGQLRLTPGAKIKPSVLEGNSSSTNVAPVS
ncbi:MAG: efflux RND transporter periplasmic adaptor subunit [Verrucomicrobiota bacterium]